VWGRAEEVASGERPDVLSKSSLPMRNRPRVSQPPDGAPPARFAATAVCGLSRLVAGAAAVRALTRSNSESDATEPAYAA